MGLGLLTVTRDLPLDDSLVLRAITHLVVDIGIIALPGGSFVGTFGHGHVVDVPGPECAGFLLSPRLLGLGTRDFHCLEAAVGIQGHAFRVLLIVLTPSNAPKCRGSKRGTHRPPGWRPRTRGDKIGGVPKGKGLEIAQKVAVRTPCALTLPQ